MDLSAPDKQVWEKIFWTALQTVLLDPYGMPIKASTYSYRRNLSDYRKSQIVRALSVLSLYQAVGGNPTFTDAEMSDIQSRLLRTSRITTSVILLRCAMSEDTIGNYYVNRPKLRR
jgi:hypothetical protein